MHLLDEEKVNFYYARAPEHFKGTKAMTRGHGGNAFVKYQAEFEKCM